MKIIILLFLITILVIMAFCKVHSLKNKHFEGSYLINSTDISRKEYSINSFTFKSCSNKDLCNLKVYLNGIETIDCSNCKYIVHKILND